MDMLIHIQYTWSAYELLVHRSDIDQKKDVRLMAVKIVIAHF